MTFVRRLHRGENTYLYNVRTYRDKKTGKVKQETEYLGKEVIEGGKTVIRPPKRKRGGLRAVLDYGPHMALLKVAQNFGLAKVIEQNIGSHTRIADIGTKIVTLAINSITSDMTIGAIGNWFSRSSLKKRLDITSDDLTPKKVRGVLELLASTNPDITGLIEEALTARIKQLYGEDLDTAVYDLTALTYHGDDNVLAQYGHAYRTTGEKQINMVLAVTLDNKLPLHHKVLPGKIVSVSTIHSFVKELEVFNVRKILLILDRGFYSKKNIEEIRTAKHDVIGALASHLSITKKVLAKSVNIENSRNLLKYPDNVIFFKEIMEDGIRVIVYHDVERRNRQIKSFYDGLAEVESNLRELAGKKFDTKYDLKEELEGICGHYLNHISIRFTKNDQWTFSYKLRHKSIQWVTNRLGKTVLFTTTTLPAADVLKTYREKDVIEKTFQLMKKHGLTPINSNTEPATKARITLSYVGYLLLSLLRMKLDKDTSLEKALSILNEVREVVYKDGSLDLPELTKPQKEILEMTGLL